MTVRVATGADAEAIERIRIRGWQTAYRHVFPPEELDLMELDWSRWTARLEGPASDSTTFVAEREGRILGFASIGPSRDELDAGELYAIYVDPDAWSSGVGRALIEHAEDRLVEEYDELMLWVLDDNPRARRFYERAGWHAEAREIHEYLGIPVLSVRYRKRSPGRRRRS